MEYRVLALAASLTIVIGIVHSWLGEVRLIGPLISPQARSGILKKSRFARNTLRFAWHLTTLAWWGFGAILVFLALSPLGEQSRIVLAVISVMFLVTGLVTLMTSRGRHLAWPVFLAIAGLCATPLFQ